MSDQSNRKPGPRRTVRRETVIGRVDRDRGVYMISVAAELAEMHPQTLRMYESKGLITPKRSAKNTRLYSQSDVERLRRIQQMTTEEGLNLAGVESVLALEDRIESMRSELERFRRRAEELEQQMTEEVERARRSLRGDLVPYGAYDVLGSRSGGRRDEPDEVVVEGPKSSAGRSIRIPVQRPSRKPRP